MAGGGFANHAMNVLKANRALLKKRKLRSRSDFLSYKSKTVIGSRNTTPAQLRAVKLQAAANRKQEIKIWLVVIGLTLLIVSLLYYFMAK